MARLQKVPEIRIETPDSPGQEEGDLSGAKLLEDESSPTVAAAHNSNSRHSHQAVKFKDEELIALQPPPVQFSHGANHHHHLGNSKSFNDSNSLFLEIPEDGNTHSKLHLPRQSIISRQSIEMFLDKFPHNETEYANQEIMGAVREIINADMGLSKEMSTLEKMRVIISSHRFHLFYIGLVVLDCICVISQMILDVFSTRLEQRHADNNSIKPLSSSSHHHGDSPLEHLEIIAECVSVSILSVFFILILCHVALLGKIYYRSKLEMFDAIIVISSLILEIVSIVQKYVREVKVAVITFRFWRIIRIVNAIVITVEKRVYRKLDNLKSDIRYIIDENLKMEEELVKKGDEIRELTSELDEKTKKINEMSKQLLEYQTEKKRQMLKSNGVINSLREDLKRRDEENVHLKNRLSKKSPKDEETS